MRSAVKGLWSIGSYGGGLYKPGKFSCIHRLENVAALNRGFIRSYSDDLSSLFDQNTQKTKKPSTPELTKRKQQDAETPKDKSSRDLDLLDLQYSKAKPAVEGVPAEESVPEPVEVEAELLPPFGSDEELIEYVAEVVNETEWRQLYDKLALLGDQVKARHVPEIIHRARGSPFVFSFYMWVRARRHIILEPTILKQLFEVLSVTDKAEEMQWLLVQMNRNKIELNDSMFVTVLLTYRRLKRTDDATKLFLKMDDLGCKPPKTSTFNCVLRLLLDAGKNIQFDMVEARMRMVRKRNVITYELLIAKACKFDAPDAALEHFNKMKESKFEVSVAGYAALVECLSKAGREDVVFELLGEMKSIPEEVYNPLVRNLVMAGKLNVALTQYKKMLEARVKPYPSTCIPILAELVVTEKAAQAGALFKEMVKSSSVSVKDVLPVVERSYALCKVEMVWNFVKDLPGLGCDFDPETIYCLIMGLAKQDRLDLSRKLFRSFLDNKAKLSVSTYNFFINRLQPDGAKQILGLMKQAECEADVHTYNGMMRSLIKENQLSEAYNYFVEMTDRELEANLTTYKLLLQLLSRNESMGASSVVDALNRLKEKGKFGAAEDYLEKLSAERLLPEKHEASDGKVLVKILQKDGRKLDEVYM